MVYKARVLTRFRTWLFWVSLIGTVLMLGGLGHKYPNGGNNPAGFSAAQEFWRFFAAHPLSQAPAPPRQ